MGDDDMDFEMPSFEDMEAFFGDLGNELGA